MRCTVEIVLDFDSFAGDKTFTEMKASLLVRMVNRRTTETQVRSDYPITKARVTKLRFQDGERVFTAMQDDFWGGVLPSWCMRDTC